MHRLASTLLAVSLLLSCRSVQPGATAHDPVPAEAAPAPEAEVADVHGDALRKIAADIAALAPEHPQLADFDVSTALNVHDLTISYDYRTHRSTARGGWTAAVPNPDPDGIWFHIDFHDPASQAQIHTQPVIEPLAWRDMRVMFLILEGEETRSVSGAIREILLRHGVRRGAAETRH